MDPISMAVAGGGMILDYIKSQQARADARNNAAQLRANLAQTLARIEEGKASAARMAGGLREDQFGNTTYYDPAQGRWVTNFSPTQQRIIDAGQERQRSAQIRGAQASSDYDKLRGEYLYRKPETEAQSYLDIIKLLNQAQGTGEQQLNTLMNRFGIRTAGNLPTLVQADNGPTPAQQLAETMLKARGAALDESIKRKSAHASEYLPALKQFESTANYVAPVDPTGSSITGMTQQGIENMLKYGSDYDKLLATSALTGDRTVASALDTGVRAGAAGGPKSSDFLNLAKLMQGQGKTAGTVGNTTGARASTLEDLTGGESLGGHDRRFNFGPSTRGAGGEAAGLGSIWPPEAEADPFAVGTAAIPNYGDVFKTGGFYDFGGGGFVNPWSFG